MSYAARTDLEQRYTAQEVSQFEASGRDIALALSDADAEIDSYIGIRYVTPIAGTAPAVIVECACDIARFRLFGVNSEGEPLERYKLRVRWLRDVSQGMAEVPGLQLREGSTSAPGVGPVKHGQAASGIDWSTF